VYCTVNYDFRRIELNRIQRPPTVPSYVLYGTVLANELLKPVELHCHWEKNILINQP
jgi:hypothetical protein